MKESLPRKQPRLGSALERSPKKASSRHFPRKGKRQGISSSGVEH